MTTLLEVMVSKEPVQALFDTYLYSKADVVRIDSYCAEAGVICQKLPESYNDSPL